MVVTTTAATLARATGVDFEIPDGGEAIPLGGLVVVTGFFSLLGVLIAVVLLRFNASRAAVRVGGSVADRPLNGASLHGDAAAPSRRSVCTWLRGG
ncbi:DUF6069 family protein [Micromonospora tulbaghiae]|uniref:DUF6069 family protein n=1 Tax=Micromonospora tulbaghiae TaxID=479978 RepID=UPI0020C7F22E|nr:DUF6069 family protein [Micromonospora tulbaghiae]MDX5461165.1 DUF6069 family protein [Micromonospora tulbaghiae]